MKHTLSALTLAALLAGCSTTPALDNIASCSLAGDELLVSSMYGPLGVTSKVRKADAEVACKRLASASGVSL